MEENKNLVIYYLDLNDESLYSDLRCPIIDCKHGSDCIYKRELSKQTIKPDLKYELKENNIIEFECIDYGCSG